MKKCTELLKNGNKSLVEIRDTETDTVDKYVVCENFDNSKAYGSKWDNGHYFDTWGRDTKEDMMKAAALYLYGLYGNPISFKRMEDIASAMIIQLREHIDDDEEFANVLKGEDITESEADFFGVKDVIFPKLYKVVNVTFKRTQYATVQVVMPDDEDVWNADEYVENKEYIEDGIDIDSEDWEYDDYGIEEDGITKEYYKDHYSDNTVWNDCDIYDETI